MSLQPLLHGLLIGVLASAGLAREGAPAPEVNPLAGLWGATRSFGPEARGQLTIFREGGGWSAQIAGSRASVRARGEDLEFALAGNRGSFRGRRDPKSARIAGMWIQPAGIATQVSWATPVDLAPIARGVWRGTVVPLEEAVTLYLDVKAEADGSMTAVLRNPDGYYRNARFKVVVEGARVRLFSSDGGPPALEATYDAKSDRLLLPVPDFGTTFDLSRQTRDQAVGYYPRTPAEPRYTYRPPIAESDGWRTGTLEAAGLDGSRIRALVQKLRDTDPRQAAAPLVQGLLIARHGRLVLEEYFYGFDEERPHDLRSGGKTLASILAGIAIDHGARFGPHTPVYSLFPEYKTFANPDPRKELMTVEHLMTMTSGFDCDENGDEPRPGNEDKMQSQTAQPDWYKFMLDLPLAAAPGDRFAYCSGGVNLVGGVIRNTTRAWLPAFFDRCLARPLQMRTYHMNLTPTGEGYLGGGIHMRARDALKLGELYLRGGVWNGRRVVSKGWVEVSTAPHPMNARGTDGYDWHFNDIRLGDRVYREYDASGNGGQLVMVLPELDLVVLFTAANYGNFGVWRHFRDELLPQYIIAAVQSRPAAR